MLYTIMLMSVINKPNYLNFPSSDEENRELNIRAIGTTNPAAPCTQIGHCRSNIRDVLLERLEEIEEALDIAEEENIPIDTRYIDRELDNLDQISIFLDEDENSTIDIDHDVYLLRERLVNRNTTY